MKNINIIHCLRCLILLFLISSTESNVVKKLANIDFIGVGYDVFLGNPHSDLHDPGFRGAIFKLSYNDNKLSGDGKWFVPDNIQVFPMMACSYRTNTVEINEMSSYQDTLSVDASVSGSFFVAKFSASTNYKEVNEGILKKHRTYVKSIAKCLNYKATINSRSLALTSEFMDAVIDLPSKKDDTQYLDFISYFGTHYGQVVIMGAKAVIQSEFEQEAMEKMRQSNLNIKAAASLSFLGITGGYSVATDREKKMKTEFEEKRSSYKAAYLGSHPSVDGKWETWAQSTGQSPYPIEYTLRPLSELFSTRYFKNINNTLLMNKQKLLEDAITRYCGGLEGCGKPKPNRIPIKMDKVASAINREQSISCRPGFALLSCGMGNIPGSPGSKNYEVFRFAYPSSSSSCACYDYFGAICYAWCTNAVQGFQIVNSGNRKGDFPATCPSGKKVIGCHIRPSFVKEEKWRRYHPTDDGNSCLCYDYFGAQCIASCASNIINYEIRKQYGRGVVKVQCTAPNYVLGCGIWTANNGGYEKWRTAFVESQNTCECYDYFGATCYAICGTFA